VRNALAIINHLTCTAPVPGVAFLKAIGAPRLSVSEAYSAKVIGTVPGGACCCTTITAL
jgi:hypothetical protein